MTRIFRANTSSRIMTGDAPTVWGFDAYELHDAYWRSHGIQCVRRMESFVPQKGLDLFMLLEPGHSTLFDHRKLSNAMSWNRAPLSRIKVTSPIVPYVERVVEDEQGDLIGIERDYRPSSTNTCRVLMTRRASLAQIWADSEERRKAWTELRRFVDWTRTDHYSTEGHVCRSPAGEKARQLILELVQCWHEPDLVLNGLVQIRPDIWGIPGTSVDEYEHVLPPAWIGRTSGAPGSSVLIGPAVIEDDEEYRKETPSGLRMLEIDEIYRSSARDMQVEDGVSLYSIIKRLIDIVVSLVVLVLFFPALLGIAAAVMINDGRPILFGHERQARGGRNFKCWKFRTMLRNAEDMVTDLSMQNIADGPQVYIRNDPRITRIGRFLRRFHLDELPQFWNVLVGDMSLVGPRPSPDKENQFCPAWREARLSVRPGITGLWQVKRTRAPGVDFQEWIKYDIEYVNRANLMLDARICARTLMRLIRG
ncbi:MAG: sugar transferase [Phycisphaerales bacterium]|nr:sugar transferase [Phycisphaerales bacterium]